MTDATDNIDAAIDAVLNAGDFFIPDNLDREPVRIAVREIMADAYALGFDVAMKTDALADTVRLDWLADPGQNIGNVQLPTKCVEANIHSLRAAIDAAMESGDE